MPYKQVEGDADERTSDQLQQQQPRAQPPLPGPSPSSSSVEVVVKGEGGSSSGMSTTYLSGGVEWSATGRQGVSLAELSGLQDTAFSFERCRSRLVEMQSKEYEERWRRMVQCREGATAQGGGAAQP